MNKVKIVKSPFQKRNYRKIEVPKYFSKTNDAYRKYHKTKLDKEILQTRENLFDRHIDLIGFRVGHRYPYFDNLGHRVDKKMNSKQIRVLGAPYAIDCPIIRIKKSISYTNPRTGIKVTMKKGQYLIMNGLGGEKQVGALNAVTWMWGLKRGKTTFVLSYLPGGDKAVVEADTLEKTGIGECLGHAHISGVSHGTSKAAIISAIQETLIYASNLDGQDGAKYATEVAVAHYKTLGIEYSKRTLYSKLASKRIHKILQRKARWERQV